MKNILITTLALSFTLSAHAMNDNAVAMNDKTVEEKDFEIVEDDSLIKRYKSLETELTARTAIINERLKEDDEHNIARYFDASTEPVQARKNVLLVYAKTLLSGERSRYDTDLGQIALIYQRHAEILERYKKQHTAGQAQQEYPQCLAILESIYDNLLTRNNNGPDTGIIDLLLSPTPISYAEFERFAKNS